MDNAVFGLLCRHCPPERREACIEQAVMSPVVKQIIRDAFESGNVSHDIEAYLRPYCLELDDEDVAPVRPRGLLRRRVQAGSQQAASQQDADQSVQGGIQPSPAVIAEPPPLVPPVELPQVPLKPVVDRIEAPAPAVVDDDAVTLIAPSRLPLPTPSAPPAARQDVKRSRLPALGETTPHAHFAYPKAEMLLARETGHCIYLPQSDGELTFGYMDPLSGVFPDIDLTYDDHEYHSVARMHARVIREGNEYYIEDFGSVNGTWLNEQRLPPHATYLLVIGDVVQVGQCQLDFVELPEIPLTAGMSCALHSTFSWRKYPLQWGQELVIGRADLARNYTPDIDLSGEGHASLLISRRHAVIRGVGDHFEVTDLRSTNTTQLDGVRLRPDAWTPIKPGQHLWLGGFGLTLVAEE